LQPSLNKGLILVGPLTEILSVICRTTSTKTVFSMNYSMKSVFFVGFKFSSLIWILLNFYYSGDNFKSLLIICSGNCENSNN